MKTHVLPEAIEEADQAAEWYDTQQSMLGKDFLREFRAVVGRIRSAPDSMARWIPYAGQHEIRYCAFPTFSYVAIFVRRSTECTVLAVSHTKRDPLYWLDRLN